ncbi:MAG: hypothetical protein CVU19_10835 [Betaproteobacteria bacterium HGW-Betaproteobacteria-13]|nr:MAG: hypothetical protein CVU19_10835 [Betaproteobacteria bacterium HGW-Betaproteobacteria-13]
MLYQTFFRAGLIFALFVAGAQAQTVAVDIGHTLAASGATSARGRSEFEFNRDLAWQLVSALRERGLTVRVINAVSRENPDLPRSLLCARVAGARLQRLGFVPTHKNARRRPYADATHAVHYYDGLAVLRHATMPALLFEAGVIKHRDEELLLRDPVRQARMADGIATAIAACLRNGDPAR